MRQPALDVLERFAILLGHGLTHFAVMVLKHLLLAGAHLLGIIALIFGVVVLCIGPHLGDIKLVEGKRKCERSCKNMP